LEPEDLLIPSLSSLESKMLLSQVSAEILTSLSRQLNVDCRILEADEAHTFVEHVTRTYGPLRPTT
jgi:hypothetical protein